MSINEVNQHIFHLIRMTCKSIDHDLSVKVDLSSFEEVRKGTLDKLEILSKGLETMDRSSIKLKKDGLFKATRQTFYFLVSDQWILSRCFDTHWSK